MRLRFVAIAAAVILAAAALFVLSTRESAYDPDFDTRIASPAYTTTAPLVLYDEGHFNTHTADGACKPFADLIRHDGYEVRVVAQPLSAGTLAGAAVLVIVGARGRNDAGDEPAFTEAETAAVDDWVRAGGAVLLVTDHWPYGPAVASLAGRWGIEMGKGLVEDPEHHDAERGDSHLIFSRENGLLGDHAILRGRLPAERIERVLTFTGQSLLGPPQAVVLLALADTAVEYPPTAPRVERQGGDVRVSMEYAAPVPAAGRAQGLALELGAGRIAVLADAGMLRAQRESGGAKVGMNVPGFDNRQLALNLMHWLSRAL